jgi:hypothetical protein
VGRTLERWRGGASGPVCLCLDEPRGLGALARWCVGSEGSRGFDSKEPSMMSRDLIAFFAGNQAGCRQGRSGGMAM